MKKNEKGFTLIELMVVIVIIGILSALAIPRMMGMSDKAKASEAPSVAKNYVTLQNAFIAETGAVGDGTQIGFDPSNSSWWDYDDATAGQIGIDIKAGKTITGCAATTVTVATSGVAAGANPCPTLIPNWPF